MNHHAASADELTVLVLCSCRRVTHTTWKCMNKWYNLQFILSRFFMPHAAPATCIRTRISRKQLRSGSKPTSLNFAHSDCEHFVPKVHRIASHLTQAAECLRTIVCKFRLSLSHVSSSFTVATQHATRIFWLSKSLKSIKSTIFGWFMSVCVCLSSWVCYIVGFIGLILFIHLPRCLRCLLCQPNLQKAVWPACEPSDNLWWGFMYTRTWFLSNNECVIVTWYSTLSWLVTATGALTAQNCWFKCQVGCCKSPDASSAILHSAGRNMDRLVVPPSSHKAWQSAIKSD